MAIFITGDTHGDFSRFKQAVFYEQENLTKNDFIIVCGDFGGVWDNSAEEKAALDWLNSLSFTTLFVCGNHENFDLLNSYKVEAWKGGMVHKIRPSVIHLMRGQAYTIEGKRFFTMGGASSHDISDGILEPFDPLLDRKRKRLDRDHALYRINHISWWKEELPSDEEYSNAIRTLDENNWSFDFIVTHCCPLSVQTAFAGSSYMSDHLIDFFEEISKKCRFKRWFFGHYHDDRDVLDKYTLLYQQIIQIT